MNWGRILAAGIVAGIVLWLVDFGLHGVVMADTYKKYSDVFTQTQQSPWKFLAIEIVVSIFVALLFGKTRASWAPGVKGGLTFGLFFALAMFFMNFFYPLVIAGFPYYLGWCWGGIGVIEGVIGGAVFGAIVPGPEPGGTRTRSTARREDLQAVGRVGHDAEELEGRLDDRVGVRHTGRDVEGVAGLDLVDRLAHGHPRPPAHHELLVLDRVGVQRMPPPAPMTKRRRAKFGAPSAGPTSTWTAVAVPRRRGGPRPARSA